MTCSTTKQREPHGQDVLGPLPIPIPEEVTSSMVEAQQKKKRSFPQEEEEEGDCRRTSSTIKQQEQEGNGKMKEQVKDTKESSIDHPTAKKRPFFPRVDKKVLEEYRKKVKESDGFDVGPGLPKGTIGNGLIFMVYSETDKGSDEKAALYANLAKSGIAFYNGENEGAEYNFGGLIRVNTTFHGAFYWYYITFWAENESCAQRFRAKVGLPLGLKKVPFVYLCDLMPESKSA